LSSASAEAKENAKLKTTIESLEKDKEELKNKIKKILEDPTDKLPSRSRKEFSDAMTKPQLKVCEKNLNAFK
jgi:predicted transcriptional regulator